MDAGLFLLIGRVSLPVVKSLLGEEASGSTMKAFYSYNNQISRVSPESVAEGDGDGVGEEVLFNYPHCVCLDPEGKVKK